MRIFGVRMVPLLLIVVVTIVAWHMYQAKRGAVAGPPHKPQAGPGTPDQTYSPAAA